MYYLVAGTNVCGGQGSLGTDSLAVDRPADGACDAQGNDGDLDGVPDINDSCPAEIDPVQLDSDLDIHPQAIMVHDLLMLLPDPHVSDVRAAVHGIT